MIDRRLVSNFDWLLLALVLALGACGVANLYSAASSFHGAGTPVFLKQTYWFGLGLGVMIAVAMVGPQRLTTIAYPLYGLVVVLLIAVLFWGKVIGGSQRWLVLGPVVLQPSELARLAVVLVLAAYFQRRDQAEPYRLHQLFAPLGLALVPALLILKEPDLGTCLLVLIVATSVILVNGVKLRDLAIAGGGLILVLPVAWRFMKDYQKRRIFSFLDPESDPLGSAYHLIQSKIAVGSGQFTGKGFMAGTQTQLHFLPEQHTDFAFSVLAEEWGFIGAMLLLLLMAGLIYRGLSTAYRTKDRQGLLIVVGATAMIFWPAIINVGMVLGLFPVVGIPLPFISYGGSSLITTMAALGLIQGVAMRRFVFHNRR
ncbi:MAG: rod shape-determining protein RodA [Desulfarculaceae bacterium]|nr:rod shape-determining protein RodA [Desulfarculaceae bacterium]MCF8073638.1 rod shape-determining protein RodA [Desulfarculaceae bacterium]MCF8103130.1 rod shape-determining protein RodA [Desulfarculaceae bacterium]MCF8115646.1 rod shape-determining protein RodA [Desulfarculaceae bacterium]